jgi:hypothetical protein
VQVKGITSTSKHDDDEINEQEPLSLKYEREWLLSLKRLIGYVHVQFFVMIYIASSWL